MEDEPGKSNRPERGTVVVRGRLTFATFFTTCFLAVAGASSVLAMLTLLFVAIAKTSGFRIDAESSTAFFSAGHWIRMLGLWAVQAVVWATLVSVLGFFIYRLIAQWRGGFLCEIHAAGAPGGVHRISYGQALRSKLVVMPLVLVLSLSGAVIYLFQQKPLYRASASVLLSPADNMSADRGFLHSEIRLISSQMLRERARKKLASNSDDPFRQLKRVAVKPMWRTLIVVVEVEAFDPHFVADYANALVDEYRVFRVETGDVDVEVLEQARPPAEPFHPRKTRTIGAAAVGGGLAGLAVALIWAAWDRGRISVDVPRNTA